MSAGLPNEMEDALPSFRHLMLFEAVARLNSVRRAAEACHLSQPAVTQAIARLEKQVGTRLFDRRARGSFINEYGAIFLRRTQRVFAQIERVLVELGFPAGQQMASRITRSQVKSLVSIVESGSFAQAARYRDVSQPSMHRAARDLERALRKTLYHRTASGMIATPLAAELARGLKLATREIELGLEELRATKENLSGRISIGVLQLTGSILLPAVLNEFVEAHPEAEVSILNGDSDSMLRSLRYGDVDCVIGLVKCPLPDGLKYESLIETPYVVAARKKHPLISLATVTAEHLLAYDWVIGLPGSSRRKSFDTLFSRSQCPSAPIVTYSLPMIRHLLASSDRLTLLTSYELMYEDDFLAALPFGPITPVNTIGLMLRSDWLPTDLQSSFLDFVRKEMTASTVKCPMVHPVAESPRARGSRSRPQIEGATLAVVSSVAEAAHTFEGNRPDSRAGALMPAGASRPNHKRRVP